MPCSESPDPLDDDLVRDAFNLPALRYFGRVREGVLAVMHGDANLMQIVNNSAPLSQVSYFVQNDWPSREFLEVRVPLVPVADLQA